MDLLYEFDITTYKRLEHDNKIVDEIWNWTNLGIKEFRETVDFKYMDKKKQIGRVRMRVIKDKVYLRISQ